MVKQLYYSEIHSKNIEIYLSKLYTGKYHIAQNFNGGNIDEFDEFPTIHQYFPYQNFLFS